MGDFSFISESDDSAVEDIIAQAIDHCVLEQVVSINSSGISDSVLPTDLESRFRKLKSFPGAHPAAKNPPPCPKTQNELGSSISLNQFEKTPISSPHEKTGSPTPTISNRAKTSPGFDRSGSKEKPRTGFIHSPSSSSDSSLEVSSPPRQGCCFWYSPKRVSGKKRKETRVSGIGGLDPLDDEFLSDLSMFSLKEQKRKLKRAMKEQEKINREAEKIVEWAKQASARIEVSAIEDLLTDDDDDEKFK
ncbi:hypothetical protein BVC80_1833g57 [Macleaya cordata]|uniref:Uncharacterized protein n=1 Tax=Macleaya cordata TaxID=56857 RepID=A0A200R6T4_MACCD|nr:hypothetical protein BVC80_1833g57 [Macleaya cordata]